MDLFKVIKQTSYLIAPLRKGSKDLLRTWGLKSGLVVVYERGVTVYEVYALNCHFALVQSLINDRSVRTNDSAQEARTRQWA